jgi:light-regulated signal transduction histidine kinase (bacteriophytochrome)
VADNGIGIDETYAERVFVIFQRLHAKELYPGTGIGLALCKKIVEFHGGRIWLDTAVGSGTTVCWTLPVPVSEADVPVPDEDLPVPAEGEISV